MLDVTEIPADAVPIYKYPNYAVTPLGDVYNIKHKYRLTPSIAADGSKRVTLYHKGKGDPWYVHVLVAFMFKKDERTRKKNTVYRIDGVKGNCRLDNLEWQTLSFCCKMGGTGKHMRENPRKGEDNPQHKLTEAQVRLIIAAHRDGRTVDQLAYKYKVHASTIQSIISGRTWAHLQ